eukprot:XP_001703819.1 predicted protein [Chlamydomonas reinhardtii]
MHLLAGGLVTPVLMLRSPCACMNTPTMRVPPTLMPTLPVPASREWPRMVVYPDAYCVHPLVGQGRAASAHLHASVRINKTPSLPPLISPASVYMYKS